MATITPEGRPHVVPFVFVLLGEDSDPRIYWLVDNKTKRSRSIQRIANIEANAAVEFVIDGYDEEWDQLWWVRVSGTGRVVRSRSERAGAEAALRRKYSQYAEAAEPGPVVAIDIERISGWEARQPDSGANCTQTESHFLSGSVIRRSNLGRQLRGGVLQGES